MSLRRIKTLYCLAVIAIGVLLAALGGWIGWVAAVLVLSGALPMYHSLIKAMARQNIAIFLDHLRSEKQRRALIGLAQDQTQATDSGPQGCAEVDYKV